MISWPLREGAGRAFFRKREKRRGSVEKKEGRFAEKWEGRGAPGRERMFARAGGKEGGGTITEGEKGEEFTYGEGGGRFLPSPFWLKRLGFHGREKKISFKGGKTFLSLGAETTSLASLRKGKEKF